MSLVNGKLLGMDTSHWQGVVNFEKAALNGAEFCYHKLTQGINYVDDVASANIKAALRNGLVCGGYHFFDDKYLSTLQAKHFINHLRRYPELLLPPVIDVEIEKKIEFKDVKNFLEIVEDTLGKRCIIYTSKHYWSKQVLGWEKDYKLWVANYTMKQPALPDGWNSWTFWQYSANKNKQGERFGCKSEDVDLDYFNGNINDLRALCGIQTFREAVWTRDMNIRALPALTGTILGIVKSGEVRAVKSEILFGGCQWAELSSGGFVVLKNLNSGNVYGSLLN